jgi:hypothetical protein
MASLPFALLFVLAVSASAAQAQESIFTDLDLDKSCKWDPVDEAEAGLGGCAWCSGLPDVPVRFCEGDLRQSVEYGPVPEKSGHWASFGQFNHMLPKIEWRVKNGAPYAAIQRRFLENENPATGTPDKAHEGQVLVISTVATKENPVSCVVAYVDARANKNANELAHKAADELAAGFRCGTDEPQYHGVHGPLAGDPFNSFE